MIVSCPSCRTRYRHVEAGSDPRLGRCSQCDETFDLAHRSRQYVVLPASRPRQIGGSPPTPLPVGMDDPSLTRQLQSSGRAVDMVLAPSQSRVTTVAETTAKTSRRGAQRPGREWFGLLLLAALGAAAGFHGAVMVHVGPLNSTAAGTVGGLILGWSWIRAAERKR